MKKRWDKYVKQKWEISEIRGFCLCTKKFKTTLWHCGTLRPAADQFLCDRIVQRL